VGSFARCEVVSLDVTSKTFTFAGTSDVDVLTDFEGRNVDLTTDSHTFI
jgi:hypothetical protein